MTFSSPRKHRAVCMRKSLAVAMLVLATFNLSLSSGRAGATAIALGAQTGGEAPRSHSAIPFRRHGSLNCRSEKIFPDPEFAIPNEYKIENRAGGRCQ